LIGFVAESQVGGNLGPHPLLPIVLEAIANHIDPLVDGKIAALRKPSFDTSEHDPTPASTKTVGETRRSLGYSFGQFQSTNGLINWASQWQKRPERRLRDAIAAQWD
jgi:hypothetical protein